jgi:phage anti-repressor protein
VYTYPDTYKIVISHPEIASSSVVPPGPTDRKSKPMSNSAQPAQRDSDRQFVQNSAKTVSIVAGTSIVQFLDQAVQRSEYIYQQQTKIKSTDNNGKEIDVVQNTGGRAFAWYTINLQATPRGTQYFDAKRNDYAYDITYEIAPYGVNQVKSEYFPKGRFRGVQKRYAYWFTGENTSVLEFEQDFNYLYYITVNSRQAAPIPLATFNYAVAEKRVFSPNSAQSNQGIEGNVNEPAANAADYLYSPGDQGRVNLTILGDPAWIAQGTVWSGVRSTRRSDYEQNDVYFDAFLSDGTINYDAREVLFEIVFNTPRDYDLATGQLRNL